MTDLESDIDGETPFDDLEPYCFDCAERVDTARADRCEQCGNHVTYIKRDIDPQTLL